jgi:hypothetical protein
MSPFFHVKHRKILSYLKFEIVWKIAVIIR